MGKPLLTVCLLTYNHAQYIEQAVDTILEQRVNFDWKIIIVDDHSTDGTIEKLRMYEKKYPHLITLIVQKSNVGPESSWLTLLSQTTSKYVLYAEGDDYFTDSTKLQTQVDFLEKNKDYALCFHPVKVKYEDGSRDDEYFPTPKQRFNKNELELRDLLKSNFMQTNSVMYRWRFANSDIKKIYPRGVAPGDWFLHILHAAKGKIGFINKTMAAYRKHSSGIWYDSSTNRYVFWEKNGEAHLSLCRELLALYGDKHDLSEIIYSRASRFINDIAHSSDGSDLHLLQMIVSKYPEFIAVNIYNNQNNIKAKEEEVVKLVKSAKDKDIQIDRLSKAISEKDAQIVEIKSSKVWRARNKIVKIAGKKAI